MLERVKFQHLRPLKLCTRADGLSSALPTSDHPRREAQYCHQEQLGFRRAKRGLSFQGGVALTFDATLCI